MIGTTEAFTRQPISPLDCKTVGISRAQGAGGSLHEECRWLPAMRDRGH